MDSKLWAKETLHLENKKERTLVLGIEHKLNLFCYVAYYCTVYILHAIIMFIILIYYLSIANLTISPN